MVVDGDRPDNHNDVSLAVYRRTINGGRVVVVGGIPNASLDRIAMDNNGQWIRMIPTTQQNNVVQEND